MSTAKPIALITGGNKGIGLELARTLARDHSFHILLGSRNAASGTAAVAKLQAEGLSSIELVVIDVNMDDTIMATVQEVSHKHGRLDVLVNNAGISLSSDPYPAPTELREIFKSTFDTNVFGATVVTESFLPLLEKAAIPRIVFMSSYLGSIEHRMNPEAKWQHLSSMAYRCSKAALNMLCATYDARFRGKGWKINAVCPGSVSTDINGGNGILTTVEAMPNLVRLCTLEKDGATGLYCDPDGPLPW